MQADPKPQNMDTVDYIPSLSKFRRQWRFLFPRKIHERSLALFILGRLTDFVCRNWNFSSRFVCEIYSTDSQADVADNNQLIKQQAYTFQNTINSQHVTEVKIHGKLQEYGRNADHTWHRVNITVTREHTRQRFNNWLFCHGVELHPRETLACSWQGFLKYVSSSDVN